MTHLPKSILVELFRKMQLIRKVELKIESLYVLDDMKTPVHLCVGQEAVAVGICSCLRRSDFIVSNHRSHGHYLAKGGDLKRLAAELYCRETGCSRGRGGSMHLVDVSAGHMGSSAIVGGTIPIGTGLALAIRMKRQDRVSVVFFGDGAADEGVLYESVNFAILKKLPVIFIYENNQYSVCSHVSARQAGESIFHRTSPEKMMSRVTDGNSVLAVNEAAEKAVRRAREGKGPSFIECKTYRMRGHAGIGVEAEQGYRKQGEMSAWEAKCPVATFRAEILAAGLAGEEEMTAIDAAVDAEIEEAFLFAQKSCLPRETALLDYLFRG